MGSDIDVLMSRVRNRLDAMTPEPPYAKEPLPDCTKGDLALILEALNLLGAVRSAVAGR